MSTSKTSNKKTNKERLVLLDANAVIHRAYHAMPGLTSPEGEPVGAIYGVIAMIIKIMQELKPDHVVACFDMAEPTYRHEAYEEYKAGRKKPDDELVIQLQRARDLMKAFAIPYYETPGFEADDLLGTIVEQTKEEKDLGIVIASGDMDTLQLVESKRVHVYTLKKGINDTILYDEKAVKERFGFGPKSIPDYKGLRGDPSDNIPGIRGIGEKTATTLISAFGSIEKLYKKLEKDEQALRDLGMTPRIINLLKEGKDEAEFSKMLATIRRDAPIEFNVPKERWLDTVDIDAVFDFCAALGFRTLIPRLEKLFEVQSAAATMKGDLTDTEFEETALALWLLESDETNPTKDDLLAYARTRGVSPDLVSARRCILDDLAKTPMQKVYNEIELPLRPVLKDMERTGIRLDVNYLHTLGTFFHKKLTDLEEEIYAQAGSTFNINSPQQLGHVLFDVLAIDGKIKRTATGKRSTNEKVLRTLEGEHPIIAQVLKYRELQKLISAYIDPLPKLVDAEGRIHTHFLQAGTTTGRLASRDPNMQNMPVRGEYSTRVRTAFIADPGYTFVALDYSQVELRIAAFLAGDEELMRIFERGEDVHTAVAARVFSVAPGDVTSNMRRHAKVINFGIMYGMGVDALRKNLGSDTTREEAQQHLNAYFESFPKLATYLERTKVHAHEYGFSETMYGRRRHFPGINAPIPRMRAQAERMAINAPIQGSSADIIRIAMVRVHEHFAARGMLDEVRMLLQIHDELLFEIKDDILDDAVKEIVHIMEHVVPAEKRHGVPMPVGIETGKNWGEMH